MELVDGEDKARIYGNVKFSLKGPRIGSSWVRVGLADRAYLDENWRGHHGRTRPGHHGRTRPGHLGRPRRGQYSRSVTPPLQSPPHGASRTQRTLKTSPLNKGWTEPVSK